MSSNGEAPHWTHAARPAIDLAAADNATDLTLSMIWFSRPVVGDTQTTHRTVLAAAGDNPGRVLWCSPSKKLLIVQAKHPLRRESIAHVAACSHGPVQSRWLPGAAVSLSLIAYPAKTADGKRVPLAAAEYLAWLERKLSGAVTAGRVAVQDVGIRRGVRDSHVVAHRQVAFTADATVSSTGLLEHLIRSGVGPGKAYGCGLLMVVPR